MYCAIPVFVTIVSQLVPPSVDLSIMYPAIEGPPLLAGAVQDRFIWLGETTLPANPIGLPGAASACGERNGFKLCVIGLPRPVTKSYPGFALQIAQLPLLPDVISLKFMPYWLPIAALYIAFIVPNDVEERELPCSLFAIAMKEVHNGVEALVPYTIYQPDRPFSATLSYIGKFVAEAATSGCALILPLEIT